MEVELTYPLAAGQQLDLELEHPILESSVCLPASTVWCRIEPGQQHPRAALEFLNTSSEQRRDVRRIQASAMSSRLILGEAVVGFLLAQKHQLWAIYDENTVKRAMLIQRDQVFQARYLGHEPSQSIHTLEVDSITEAAAMILGLPGVPKVVAPDGGCWVPVRAPRLTAPRSAPTLPTPPATFNSTTAKQKATTRRERLERAEAEAAATSPTPAPEPTLASAGSPLLEALAGGVETPIDFAPPAAASPSGAAHEPDPALRPGNSSSVITSGAFHRVLAQGQTVGYLAVMSVDDAWSLFDSEWTEVAILAPHGDKYRVTLVGEAAEDSLDYMVTKTFLGGVGLAFNLTVEPELDPPMADPSSSSEGSDDALALVDAPPPEGRVPSPPPPEDSAVRNAAGVAQAFDPDVLNPMLKNHEVLDETKGLVGYVAETPGVEGVYSVFDADGSKLAIVAPENGRYKILYMGETAGDSLEYLVARSFLGALAITFELLTPPRVDPPL
jgi:hypothetical protein